MAIPRSAGGRWSTRRASMKMLPESRSSRPAIARSKVDLPQPEPPTTTQNSPSSSSRLTPFRTAASPKLFTALSTYSAATIASRVCIGLRQLVGQRKTKRIQRPAIANGYRLLKLSCSGSTEHSGTESKSDSLSCTFSNLSQGRKQPLRERVELHILEGTASHGRVGVSRRSSSQQCKSISQVRTSVAPPALVYIGRSALATIDWLSAATTTMASPTAGTMNVTVALVACGGMLTPPIKLKSFAWGEAPFMIACQRLSRIQATSNEAAALDGATISWTVTCCPACADDGLRTIWGVPLLPVLPPDPVCAGGSVSACSHVSSRSAPPEPTMPVAPPKKTKVRRALS